MDNPSSSSFAEYFKTAIDFLCQSLPQSDQTRTDKKNELLQLLEENGHELIWHFLYNERTLADKCPDDVLHEILSSKPEAILMTDSNALNAPLVQFISRGSQKIARLIIEFMARDVKKRNLFALGCKAAERVCESDIPNEADIHELSHEYGMCVIQNAFDFYGRGPLLPLKLDLLEMLVRLAHPAMLRKATTGDLSPLQQALRFDLCIEHPKDQLSLVRLILDKHEGSICEIIQENEKVRFAKSVELSKTQQSVYQWHVTTQEDCFKNQRGHTRAGTNDIRLHGPLADFSPTRRLVDANVKDMKREIPSKPAPSGKETKMLSLPNQGASAVPKSSSSVATPAKVVWSKANRNLDGDTQPGGPAKEALQAKPSRAMSGIANVANKNDMDAAKKASEAILRELGLRFLRWTLFHSVRDMDAGIHAFFGNETCRYHFAMDLTKVYNDMTESSAMRYFQQWDYYYVLRHVVLPNARILLENENKTSKAQSRYADQLRIFSWLRKWGVKKILKVVVDDHVNPHRDEEIEMALGDLSRGDSFDVEVLDWRKEDLCPLVIRAATPRVRELHLRWSGTNSVLRGWSEAEGLPLLDSLRKLFLYYEQPSANKTRVEANVEAFIRRMKHHMNQRQERNRSQSAQTLTEGGTVMSIKDELKDQDNQSQEIEIEVNGMFRGPNGALASDAASAMEEPEQPWFKHVEDFVSLIPPMDFPGSEGSPMRRVRVALIDDGVDMFNKGMHRLHTRFWNGRSFDQTPDGPRPFYSSVSGHGTFMAKSILRICPFADIVPYRLMITPDVSSKLPRPVPRSAAKAIRAAIRDDVDIISMSWTIRKKEGESEEAGMEELASVITEARNAKRRIPIMFCAASDDGNQAPSKPGNELPRDIDKDVFCIGAADSTGQIWPKVTEHEKLNYIFPGVNIRDVFEDEVEESSGESASMAARFGNLVSRNGQTGSSVATALAAGLAALLIHCTKLGFYYTEESNKLGVQCSDQIKAESVRKISTFAGMKSALDKLGVDSQSGAKYNSPTEIFGKATMGLKSYEAVGGPLQNMPDSLGSIAVLCRNLCDA